MLFRAKTEEALDGRMTVGAVLPFAGGAPFELRGLGRVGERLTGAEQGFGVDAVIDGLRHWGFPLLVLSGPEPMPLHGGKSHSMG